GRLNLWFMHISFVQHTSQGRRQETEQQSEVFPRPSSSYHLFAQFLSCAECPSHILADQRPQPTSAHHTMWSSQMSQSEEFRKGIEHLIDQMIARLPEEMQSAVRKQLADRREVAWMARAEAIEAQEEQKRLEAEAKLVADSAEQELMRLLVSSLSR